MFRLWDSLSEEERYRLDRWVDCTVVWLLGLLAVGLLAFGQASIMVGSATGIIMTALGGAVLLLLPLVRTVVSLDGLLYNHAEPFSDDYD